MASRAPAKAPVGLRSLAGDRGRVTGRATGRVRQIPCGPKTRRPSSGSIMLPCHLTGRRRQRSSSM